MKNGILLINLGTPASPTKRSVRQYLQEFLSDKRVIDLPTPLRYLLLYTLVLPFKFARSTRAYQTIWQKEGSPLLVNSRHLESKLQAELGEEYSVVLGMRYGQPSISSALKRLQDCKKLIILPLYPQYSSAATGSSIEEVLALLSQSLVFPSLRVIKDFYQQPGFIKAQAALIKPYVNQQDFILFSYHGLPERQLKKLGCAPVCRVHCPPISATNASCYKAQCEATTKALAQELELAPQKYLTAFQSKLGKTPWIQPATNDILIELAGQGVKNLAISCPSFVADCIETLEEIGIRAKKLWAELGGENLTLIPCLNDSDLWVRELAGIAKTSIYAIEK